MPEKPITEFAFGSLVKLINFQNGNIQDLSWAGRGNTLASPVKLRSVDSQKQA